MKDLFSQTLLDKISSAKESKLGKHKDKIKAKLTELQDLISTLDQKKKNIGDEKTYNEYVSFLKSAIKSTIEQISAPTVDDFISWLEQTTDNKNENTKKLRQYLISNISDTVSSHIDSILSAKDILEQENILFSNLLTEVRKTIKKECNDFLNKPIEFENNIDGFLKNLDDNLIGLSEIKEISFCRIEELYTEQQKNNNIDFYNDIIKRIVEENQSLKPINAEKDDGILTKVIVRINDIKKCLVHLDKSGIAKLSDNTIKNIFLSFTDDMIKYEKGISANLDEFLTQKWEEIFLHYDKIKVFFDNAKKIKEEDNWKSFQAKEAISVVILKYNPLLEENPLLNLQSKSLLGIQQALTSKLNKIKEFENEAKNTKQTILDVFKKTVQEYSNKLDLIKTLDKEKILLNKIEKEGIEGLNNGCESLGEKDLITYLNDDFSSDLITYNNIRLWFNEVLQKSGMKTHHDWLEALLCNEKSGKITNSNFDENILKELLSKGLITLTIEKTF